MNICQSPKVTSYQSNDPLSCVTYRFAPLFYFFNGFPHNTSRIFMKNEVAISEKLLVKSSNFLKPLILSVEVGELAWSFI